MATMSRRATIHAFFFFLAWPLASFLCGAVILKDAGTSVVRWAPNLLTLAPPLCVAMLRLSPEFIVVATLGWIASVVSFTLISGASRPALAASRAAELPAMMCEPLLIMSSAFVGIALEYPSVLNHPALGLLRDLSVAQATALLAGGALLGSVAWGYWRGGPRGAGATAACMLGVALCSWKLPCLGSGGVRSSRSDSALLLCIDALSQWDNLSVLRKMARQNGGTWYERPVTPGLFTNAVWSSILMHRPVTETGIYYLFQSGDWRNAEFNLVREARKAGYVTWSYFMTQITCYVGSDAGFDFDRSSPKGWLQVMTAVIKDASIVLPVLLPRLPHIPLAGSPANQSGTFAYDLRGDIRTILTAGGGESGGKAFVVAHLDFLHQARYPSFSMLSPVERSAVRRAPVGAIRDRSLDWRYPIVRYEPLSVYQWKIRHIQKVLAEELSQTGFLAPGKSNRLVLFSDHGSRQRLDFSNFDLPMYHRVFLTTFGVPSRDSGKPVSLLDISDMLGFRDPAQPGPADPTVNFAMPASGELSALKQRRAIRFHLNGKVELPGEILAAIWARLRAFKPYADRRIDRGRHGL